MVAGFFRLAGLRVYPAVRAFLCERLGGHDIVEPPSDISFESVGYSVVPECVHSGLVAMLSKQVDKAPVHDFIEGLLNFGTIADMAPESFGVINIYRQACYVKITEPDERLAGVEVSVEVCGKSFEPF